MSEDGSHFSLISINTDGLGKAASTLIEKIADATGGLFRSRQVERMAKAEAKADLIRVDAEIEMDARRRRALQRLVDEEAKRQDNMEGIAQKALADLSGEAKPEDMDDDWITNFFDKCRLISDEEMQSLWAKVLAGEANDPGSYSKRTVNFLSDLDRSDARLFTSFCGFCWDVGGTTPLIFNVLDDMYSNSNLTFESLTHLDSIGLIQFNNISGFSKTNVPKYFVTSYFDEDLLLIFAKDKNNRIEVGKSLLTRIGLELAPICGCKPVDGFFEYVVGAWQKKGYLPKD